MLSLANDSYLHQGRRRRWADRQRWRLDDKLPDILAEVLARAEIDERRQLDRDWAEQEEQSRWEDAVADARQRWAEDRRIHALSEQLTAWRRAADTRTYCAVLEAAATAEPNADRAADIRAWAAWIREYADRTDPTQSGRAVPPLAIDPTGEDLRPYLKGSSPYEPKRSYRR